MFDCRKYTDKLAFLDENYLGEKSDINSVRIEDKKEKQHFNVWLLTCFLCISKSDHKNMYFYPIRKKRGKKQI